MNKDQAYGAVVLVASLAAAVLYLVSAFASYFGLPTWLMWCAIATPVILGVLAVLTICMWVGWTILTTPPPPPFEETIPLPIEPGATEDKDRPLEDAPAIRSER